MLTRELLESGAYLAAFKNTPEITWWTEAQIDESLRATLAQRPDPDAPVWLFAYGSLIWNPAFHFVEKQRATLQGWRRSFCMRLIAGRGCSNNPGRMLALDVCPPDVSATGPYHPTVLPTAGHIDAGTDRLDLANVALKPSTSDGTPADSDIQTPTRALTDGSTAPVTLATQAEPHASHPPWRRSLPEHAEHRPTHTTGMALRLDEAQLEHELKLVWIREMIGGSYCPLWREAQLADGRIVQTIIFAMNHQCPFYEPDASVSTVAPIIANASGHLGPNVDYLLELDKALRQHQIHDPYVRDLIDAVRVYAADI